VDGEGAVDREQWKKINGEGTGSTSEGWSGDGGSHHEAQVSARGLAIEMVSCYNESGFALVNEKRLGRSACRQFIAVR
jgi:hypothetical protein